MIVKYQILKQKIGFENFFLSLFNKFQLFDVLLEHQTKFFSVGKFSSIGFNVQPVNKETRQVNYPLFIITPKNVILFISHKISNHQILSSKIHHKNSSIKSIRDIIVPNDSRTTQNTPTNKYFCRQILFRDNRLGNRIWFAADNELYRFLSTSLSCIVGMEVECIVVVCVCLC